MSSFLVWVVSSTADAAFVLLLIGCSVGLGIGCGFVLVKIGSDSCTVERCIG